MAMIDAKTAQKITAAFANVTEPVTLTVFIKEHECTFCRQTHDLVEELSALSDKLVTERFDLDKDGEVAARYGVERAPAIVVHGQEDRGIRFYGIPAGYEFTNLLESILDFGTARPSPLSAETQQALKAITKPAKIQVFFTPQCPYCHQAVRLAHLFAFASEQITAEAIEASEFPDLVQKFHIQGVPKTVINETVEYVGAVPEKQALEHVLEAVR